MNILHITAQKPSSTGSGIYLTQLVRAIGGLSLSDKQEERSSLRQAVLFGAYEEDLPALRTSLSFGIPCAEQKELSLDSKSFSSNDSEIILYPVTFNTQALPFHIFGMSDVMPYPSSQYSTMTDDQLEAFRSEFVRVADQAVEEFAPDVILCHHLYLLTALIRRQYPDIPVCAFCHNTDLAQLAAHDLEKDFIREQIPRLDAVFALHERQRGQILDAFDIEEEKVHVTGIGYDPDIFYDRAADENALDEDLSPAASFERPIQVVFAGKISEAKGVPTLIRAMKRAHERAMDRLARGRNDCALLAAWTSPPPLVLAGSSGDPEEYEEIRELAGACQVPVIFAGQLSQTKLADLYRRSDVFVLPSLNEGLPLSVIEALACGMRVVMNDLPGIRAWFDIELPGNDISFIPLPPDIDLLADAIIDATLAPRRPAPDLSHLTWSSLAAQTLNIIQ